MTRINKLGIMKLVAGVALLTAAPIMALSSATVASAAGQSTALVQKAVASPLTCGWEVAESAYLTYSGTNYGVTDLNYNSCNQNVYGSLGSYIQACPSGGGTGCGAAGLERSDARNAGCSFTTGETGCNTGQLSDAGYTSYADGQLIDYSIPGGSVSGETGWF